MGYGLLERRAAQRLIACLAPPFDGEIVEPSLREMMGNDFWLDGRAVRIVAQEFGRATVQRPPAALEQTVVGCVLDQCMLEAIIGPRRRTLDKTEGLP